MENGNGTGQQVLQMLKKLIEKKGSDLHIVPDNPPGYRIHGKITKEGDVITSEKTHSILMYLKSQLIPAVAKNIEEKLKERGNAGFSIEANSHRFRVNVSKLGGGYYIVFREIKSMPPRIEELGFMPRTIEGLNYVVNTHAGLFLVVGGTGSGKSTTLASLIRRINETYPKNIITLEDPIEYLHKPQKSQIVQKELGRDFPRFTDGLHSALREDPDVILVGEIRDEVSLELCLKASETGHLVFATLHTNDAVSTIKRMTTLSKNPKLTRDQLASMLIGVLAQRLAPRKDGTGRVLLYELMITDKAVSSLIREGKDEQITAQLDTMQYSNSFNRCIEDRYREGLIDRQTALKYSPDKKYLRLDGENTRREAMVID